MPPPVGAEPLPQPASIDLDVPEPPPLPPPSTLYSRTAESGPAVVRPVIFLPDVVPTDGMASVEIDGADPPPISDDPLSRICPTAQASPEMEIAASVEPPPARSDRALRAIV